MKCALITGITGQDGSYLAELLLAEKYEVHGVIRRASSFNTGRIDHIYDRLHLHYGDMADGSGLRSIIHRVKPDEVYNLAAQSHVRVSFECPEYTMDVVANGAMRLFDAIRDYRDHSKHDVRVYQAGSSEMFGSSPAPQDEDTPFRPCSPYGVAKVAAHEIARNYRDAYGMFITNGILFNHESPRRGETFVTRKITRAVGRIKEGLQKNLVLGNLSAKRDWGFAGDYVRAMHMMLQAKAPADIVIATGKSWTVEAVAELAFRRAGLNWRKYVATSDRYLRPTEVEHLEGRWDRARRMLLWEPRVTLPDLIDKMVDSDLELARQERTLREAHAVEPRRI